MKYEETKKKGYKNCQPLENETDRRRRMTRDMQIERRAELRTEQGGKQAV